MVVGTIRAQNVQPFAAAAHAYQQTLTQQQPAGKHQVQAPNRMASIDIVPACAWGTWPLRLPLMPRDPLDESLLLVRIPFPQEATHLVVGNAKAFEQILDAAGRIRDTKGRFEPVPDLVGVAKA